MDRTYVEGDLFVTVLVHDGVPPVEGDGFQLHRPRFSNVCRDSGTAQSMIETIDPAYYTLADGDGKRTAAREAGVDVGGDRGPAAECRPSVLRATGSDSRLVVTDRCTLQVSHDLHDESSYGGSEPYA